MHVLSESEVRIFYAQVDRVECGTAELEMLAPDERARYDRFHFSEDKKEFLAARSLLRKLLAKYFVPNLAAKDLVFSYGDHGKPRLSELQNVNKVFFNVSHSKGEIVLAFSGNEELGVDVEFVERTANYIDIARHAFSEVEFQELNRLSGNERQTRFYQYWTLKESFIKANGAGLAIALDGFHYDLALKEGIRMHGRDVSDGDSWRFRLLTPVSGYQVALAVKSSREVFVTETRM